MPPMMIDPELAIGLILGINGLIQTMVEDAGPDSHPIMRAISKVSQILALNFGKAANR